MRGAAVFLFLILHCAALAQDLPEVTFSEVMFYPAAANSEFIELYNFSSSKSIDLSRFSVKYQSAIADTIVSASGSMILPPNCFALIVEGDYDLSSGIYSGLIPADALVLKIDNNSFGQNGMSNTAGRTLYLNSNDGEIIDSFTYSADNTAGISDEKILLNKDNTISNWANSLSAGGSPGKTNSVSGGSNSLIITSLEISPCNPFENESLTLRLIIKNSGHSTIQPVNVEAGDDLNFDSLVSTGEKFYSESFPALAPSDSLSIIIPLPGYKSGLRQIAASAAGYTAKDTVSVHAVLKFSVQPPANKFNDIVINEIMYAPQQNGEPEWIELFNRSATPVNLKDWKFSDGQSRVYISQKDAIINPGEFVIVSRDSSVYKYYSIKALVISAALPALNNTGDDVVISDPSGLMIDSLKYLPSWGGLNGRSLERINTDSKSTDPLNWKTSTAQAMATPGRINSVSRKEYDISLKEIIISPELPKLNENVSVSAVVANTGKNTTVFHVELYEDTNADSTSDKLLETSPEVTLRTGESLQYSFNFFIPALKYETALIAKAVSASDEDTDNNSVFRLITPGYMASSIVINEIMYAPESGHPEWIEIYNTTEDSINLKNWTISDLLASPSAARISAVNNFFYPQTYALLSRDSSVYRLHPSFTSRLFTAAVPSLNNDEDGIVLKDNTGSTIDTLRYFSYQGGLYGTSLERRSVMLPSTDQSNWANSKDILKSTPGRVNSISQKNIDAAVTSVLFNPAIPLQGDTVFVSSVISNPGKKNIVNLKVQFLIKSYSAAVFEALAGFANINIPSGDSLVLTSPVPVFLKGKFVIAVKAVLESDEDSTNNYKETVVEPGYERNSIVINEVMYDPLPAQPEWFEIYNTSGNTIDPGSWSFSTLSSSLKNNFGSSGPIKPGEYFVIARDSSFLTTYTGFGSKFSIVNFRALDNTKDGIVIYDSHGNVIDSIKFNSSWGKARGRSIERISFMSSSCDSMNWSVSLSEVSSTPGEKNSAVSITPYRKNSLVINEIMFDPAKTGSEFIELYNTGEEPVNLAGFQVYEKNGSRRFLTFKNLYLPKGEYFVIASDSSVLNSYPWLAGSPYLAVTNEESLGLLNTEDKIMLKDASGNLIDSVCYSEKWHNSTLTETRSRSLERVNPMVSSNDRANWSTSVAAEGATPGRINSIFVLNQKAEKKFSILPNPFSPDNDGHEDFTIINYNFPGNINGVRIKIFDSQGRLVRTLINQSGSPHGSVVFNGLNDNGSPLQMGIYILFLEELGNNSVVEETIKSVVVVARKL